MAKWLVLNSQDQPSFPNPRDVQTEKIIMTKNMGDLDRVVRFLGAVVLGILYFAHVVSGTVALVSLIIAILLLLTSLVGYCPLYAPFGITTHRK